MQRITVLKPTTDDWYPPYRINGWYHGQKDPLFVEVSFLELSPGYSYQYRVCAWGGDDFGLEKDFTAQDEAKACFIEIIGLDVVDVEALKSRGFVYC